MTASNDPAPETGASTRLFPKGHLKIFLGASPGVGKTYAMLQAAQERKSEGVDVVVALVETHKRKETEDQLRNLEILPRKLVPYRNRVFKELDLDGVLERAPKLVLIDECAHSNLPGSRHPKRYNDITEILEHGINVYTTVNIQHFESLKDIVEKSTHVTIRETIPDSFVQSADEIQLIDLPPDDLLQRLADGKVYVPEQAKEAIEHFFSRANLLTLRELALRQTVTIADEKMSQYIKQLGVKGPWPASDKVMVCIGTDPSNVHLVRLASWIAERLQAKWVAATVETAEDESRTLTPQQQLSQALHLAEEQKAEVVVLDGDSVAQTLVEYALANNVTDLIVGQPNQHRFLASLPLIGFLFRGKSIAEQILSLRPNLTVRVIPTEEAEQAQQVQTKPKSFFLSLMPYLYSLVITFGMLFAAEEISKHTKMTDVSTFFLVGILWASIKFGLRPALVATLLGTLVYDYYYIEPTYTVGISTIEGWLIVFSFCFITVIVSNLAIHSRNVLKQSQGRLRQIRFFSNFANQLNHLSKPDQIMSYLCKELHKFLNISVIAFWDTQEDLTPPFQFPKLRKNELNDVDSSAIQWALAHKKRTGKSTENFSDAHYLYIPIKIGNNSLGVIGIWGIKDRLTIDDLRIAQSLVDQVALAIDRVTLQKPETKNKD